MSEWAWFTTTITETPREYRITYERWRGMGMVVAVRLCNERITGIYLPMPGEELVWRDLPLLKYLPAVLDQSTEEYDQSQRTLDWIQHNHASFVADPPESG